MGFLKRILQRIFFRPDYDEKLSNLDKRISELDAEKITAEGESELLKKKEISIPSFEIKNFSETKLKEVKPFNPPKMHLVQTMKDLQQKRKEKEAERIRQLQKQVAKNFDTVKIFIEDEDVDSAEDLLFSTSSSLKELKDEQLNNLYEELCEDIYAVREEIHQREILRLEEITRKKAEEEERKREQERLRKQKEEEERLEKERKAREYEEQLSREERKRHLEIERLTELVTRKKDDATSILHYLKMKGVNKFYHFTDRENLYQIKKLGGLYSWSYCKKNNINIPNPGGDDLSRRLDVRNGLEDFVRLSFCNNHPMAYRKHQDGSSLVLLYIDVEVATFKETLFTDKNAASNSFVRGGQLNDLEKVNITATKRRYVSSREGETFQQHQAECMIKTFIPLKYISNINEPEEMNF